LRRAEIIVDVAQQDHARFEQQPNALLREGAHHKLALVSKNPRKCAAREASAAPDSTPIATVAI
jgi:hypothetical protein